MSFFKRITRHLEGPEGRIDYDVEWDDEADYYDDNPLEMPFCCRTCGGNYPDCADSCSILDED